MAVCGRMNSNTKRVHVHVDENCRLDKSTMSDIWIPEMDGYDIRQECCVICGCKAYRMAQHHVVPRSAGELYRDGKKLKKPTVTVCGAGNNEGCHGKLHSGLAHLRFREGHYETLVLDHPATRLEALDMSGWRSAYEEELYLP